MKLNILADLQLGFGALDRPDRLVARVLASLQGRSEMVDPDSGWQRPATRLAPAVADPVISGGCPR